MIIPITDILRKVWLAAMLSAVVFARAQTDSLHLLEAVEVSYSAPPQGATIGRDGAVRVSAPSLSQGIHVLGEADAVRALSMLPGFSGGSDYGGGLVIDGYDYAHNVFVIEGARVLHPFHFGGIFSDFNTRHISSVRTGGKASGGMPSCIGSVVEVSTPTWVPEDVGVGADLGLISAGASVRAPMGKSMGLWLAGRVSYLDVLYGDVLSADDNSLSYGFNDANLTWSARLTESDNLKVDVFTSADKLHFDDDDYLLSTRLKWRNMAADAEYTHMSHDSTLYTQQVCLSGIWSRLDLDMTQFGMRLPSSAVLIGAMGRCEHRLSGSEVAYRLEHGSFAPQQAQAFGAISSIGSQPDYESWSLAVEGRREFDMPRFMKFSPSLSVSVYKCGGYRTVHADPEISLSKVGASYLWRMSAKTASQYMHQVGMSDIGLASNFWIPAIREVPAQRSYGAEVFGSYSMATSYLLSGKVYAYWVTDCPEYDSDVLALIAEDYDPMAFVHTADGYNAGGNIALSYTSQSLNWRAGYSLAFNRRRFADRPDEWVSSATEPLSSFKLSADWRVNSRLTLSAYATLATGRPYTPVRAIYVVGGNILTEYGKRYSARLPQYQRVDVSASYRLSSLKVGGRKVESFVNLSVINALAHRNVEIQYFSYNDKSNTISLRQVCSLYRLLPSLSYSLRF